MNDPAKEIVCQPDHRAALLALTAPSLVEVDDAAGKIHLLADFQFGDGFRPSPRIERHHRVSKNMLVLDSVKKSGELLVCRHEVAGLRHWHASDLAYLFRQALDSLAPSSTVALRLLPR